jgi:hypothetical protein
MIAFYGSLNEIDWCKLLDKMLDIWKINDTNLQKGTEKMP